MDETIFRVEPELIAELREWSDEDILNFAELHEDAVDTQPELYIFTYYLLYTRTRSTEHLEKALLVTEGWLAVTGEEDVDHLHRLKLFDMLTAEMCHHAECTTKRDQSEHAIREARHALESNKGKDADRADVSEKLASLLYIQYTKRDEIPDLEEALRMMRQAVDLTPTKHEGYPQRLQKLVILLQKQFQRTGKMEDVNRVAEMLQQMRNSSDHAMPADQQFPDVIRNQLDAMDAARRKQVETIEDIERLIHLTRQTLDAVRDTDVAHASMLNYLGSKLRKRYNHTNNAQDLDEAIGVLQEAIDLTPDDQPQLMFIVCEMGITLSVRYKKSKDLSDLEKMVLLAQRASRVPQSSNHELAHWLNDLGGMLFHRYEQTKTLQDLEIAIRVMQQGIRNTSHPDIGNVLRNLGHLYYTRYGLTQEMNDFDTSLHLVQRALDSSHGDDSSLQRTRDYLKKLVEARFERTQSTEDLEKMIRACRQTVGVTLNDNADRTDELDHLGFLLEVRCGLTKNVNDIKEAIRVTKEGIDLAHKSPLPFKWRLGRLSHQLWDQCERLLSEEELKEQIQVSRMVVELPHDNTEQLAYSQTNLSVKIGSLYKLTGDPAGIEEAILWGQHAVDTASETHPSLRTFLDNLGVFLSLRYDHQNDIQDLERGIYLTRQAIKLETSKSLAYAELLNNLAAKLSKRHRRIGTIGDLNEAIRLAEEALKIISIEHPGYGELQNNLSSFLLHRFQRLDDGKDLERAIKLTEDTPLDSHLAHAWHHALATQLNRRYIHKGNEEDAEKAIEELRKALNMTTDDHRNRAILYHELGNVFSVRFLRSARDETYLEESIRYHEQAVEIVAKDHAELCSILIALGISLRMRYEQSGEPADLENLVRVYIRAWECKNARPIDRIQASISALELLQWQEKFEVAYNLAVETLELLPHVHGRFLTHEDQQYVVRHFSGLATSACALALQLGKEPEEALKLLEQGRGLILGLLMDDRSDISPLKEAHPNLNERYTSLIANANNPTGHSHERQEKPPHVREDEINKIIKEIRQQPGFEGFLLPPSGALLRNAAENGPVVVINVSKLSCHAFLIRSHDIQVLPLPDLTEQELRVRARGFLKTPETLAWLWDTVASPIMNALGFIAPPDGDEWPHVWWILTGALTKFPLHAAGRHFVGSTETVIDRVMSSYSPSIKAIVHGRQSPAPTTKSTAPDQALLVAIPDAPSLPMLGHANEEVAVLQTLLESGPLALRAIQPGRSKHDIISKLPSCNIFHFAGHGKTDYRSPIQSSLCLEDWETDPLTVDTLLKLNLHKSSPFLAYLSACGTGDISDEKFLDESIHLTSACQLAGFRHVIGTLWEVDDQACVDIARITYEEMGRKGMTDESVCLGLHKAIRWFRDNESSVVTASGRDWDETDHIRDAGDEVGLERNAARVHRKARIPEEVPLHWVPYVHFGV